MLIDTFLPEPDVSLVRTTLVEADGETVFDDVLDTPVVGHGVVQAASWLRNLPETAQAMWEGTSGPETSAPNTLRDLVEADKLSILAENPDEEIVLGTTGDLWKPTEPRLSPVPGDAFEAFDEPGKIRLAITVSIRPYGTKRALVAVELRAAATSDDARERFLRAWPMLRPVAIATIGIFLRGLTREHGEVEQAEETEAVPERTEPPG